MATRTKAEWKRIVEDQKNSELSVENYCKTHHVSPGAFYRHKRMLDESGPSNAQAFTLAVIDEEMISFCLDGHHIECTPSAFRRMMELL